MLLGPGPPMGHGVRLASAALPYHRTFLHLQVPLRTALGVQMAHEATQAIAAAAQASEWSVAARRGWAASREDEEKQLSAAATEAASSYRALQLAEMNRLAVAQACDPRARLQCTCSPAAWSW